MARARRTVDCRPINVSPHNSPSPSCTPRRLRPGVPSPRPPVLMARPLFPLSFQLSFRVDAATQTHASDVVRSVNSRTGHGQQYTTRSPSVPVPLRRSVCPSLHGLWWWRWRKSMRAGRRRLTAGRLGVHTSAPCPTVSPINSRRRTPPVPFRFTSHNHRLSRPGLLY